MGRHIGGHVRHLLVVHVDDLERAVRVDLEPVRERSRHVLSGQVASTRQFGGRNDGSFVAGPGADEEDETRVLGHHRHHLRGPAEVGCRDVEGDDVSVVSDTEDVRRIRRVPLGGRVAEVGLVRHQGLEVDLVDRQRLGEDVVRVRFPHPAAVREDVLAYDERKTRRLECCVQWDQEKMERSERNNGQSTHGFASLRDSRRPVRSCG